jgi:miniconductance mechanosensitive channel
VTYINKILKTYDISKDIRNYLAFAILVIAVILTCFIINFILKHIFIRIISKLILRDRFQWDDVLVKRKVLERLANIVPGIIIHMYSPAFEKMEVIVQRIASIYILLMLYLLVNSALDAVNDVYITHPISKIRPMKGILQVTKIILYAMISIVLLGTMMNQNPLLLLSGVGALAAVFSFVFKDSILGFIAGIQLTSNDMLRIGDWIEMAKYGADGDVVDITLNTIKVQNFDKTIVTIPAYALVSDSFRNWRGMLEFGGRRIKRSIYIDVNSITFCTPEMLENYKKINYLKDYIIEKQAELEYYNLINNKEESLANGRHLTNIGTFRVYIQFFLNDNPNLSHEIPLMVRQLPPGENGLPLEIYAFTKTINWTEYETIQADIFDHIFSVAGEFGIRIFQNPTGYDMRNQLREKD